MNEQEKFSALNSFHTDGFKELKRKKFGKMKQSTRKKLTKNTYMYGLQ